jgi:hypothetical protein
MSDRRSYSSDHITVGNDKLTKDSNSPGLHATLEGNETIDAFVQGKYCSCPSLVPSQHLSSALEACLDLGRQELESHLEKSSPTDEENYLDVFKLDESGSQTMLNEDNTMCDNLKEKLPQRGRSVSLPLVLVHARHISQTESLFWSLDKIDTVIKVERAESWPTLSSSICNLDLRPVEKIDASDDLCSLKNDNKRNSDQEMMANNCVSKTLNNDDKNLKKMKRASAVKQLSSINKPGKSGNDCPSQSGSQASMSSVGTSESQKSAQRKFSASSTSSANSQSRKTKSKRNPNSSVIHKSLGRQDLTDESSSKKPMRLKLIKRQTVSGLQKFQPDARPSVTRRPTSTLSEPPPDSSPIGSPSYAKSKLPTIRKTPPGSGPRQSTSSASKPPPKGSLNREAKGVPKDSKKATGPVVADKKKAANAVDKSSTQRKVSTSTPSSQKTVKKVDTQVTKRGKPTSKSARQSGVSGSG